MRVKIMMTLHIDAEEYPIPADGRVDDEMEEYIQDGKTMSKEEKLGVKL